MARISNADRSKRSREKQRSTLPMELIVAKNKSVNQKKKLSQLSRRLQNKEYDVKLLQQNRERVRKYREKKRALQKENIPPTSDISHSDNVQSSQFVQVTPSQHSATTSSDNSSTKVDKSNTPNDDSGSSFDSAGDFMGARRPGNKVRFAFSTPKSRQKEAGEKRRRETLRYKNSELEELQNKVKTLEITIEKLESDNLGLVVENCDLKKKLKSLENDKSEKFSWLKPVWKNCSPDLKKDFKAAVHASKEELSKGVISGIREQAGINFSNPLPISDSTRGSGDLKQKIQDFAIKNSYEVPDKKMAKKKIRYMNHWKIVLHQEFLMENPDIDCHYTTFCANFPPNIIKPGLNSHGSCLCEDCENFSLKIEALRRYKFLEDNNIDSIIRSNREGDYVLEEEFLRKLDDIKKGEAKDAVVLYFVWKDEKVDVRGENTIKTTKKMTRMNFQVTVSTLVERIQETFEPLKQHLHRDRVIKNYIREIRQKTEDDSSVVCLTVDWSENGTLISPAEV